MAGRRRERGERARPTSRGGDDDDDEDGAGGSAQPARGAQLERSAQRPVRAAAAAAFALLFLSLLPSWRKRGENSVLRAQSQGRREGTGESGWLRPSPLKYRPGQSGLIPSPVIRGGGGAEGSP